MAHYSVCTKYKEELKKDTKQKIETYKKNTPWSRMYIDKNSDTVQIMLRLPTFIIQSYVATIEDSCMQLGGWKGDERTRVEEGKGGNKWETNTWYDGKKIFDEVRPKQPTWVCVHLCVHMCVKHSKTSTHTDTPSRTLIKRIPFTLTRLWPWWHCFVSYEE